MRDRDILGTIAARLRAARDARGLSLVDLAERSGLSRRYLTEAEAGRANLSILKLARLAQALRLEMRELCDVDLARDRTQRIALIGLRGAGKTTIGRRIALALEVPFIELDQRIVERTGLTLEQIFSLHGEPYYRRVEREALEAHLESAGSSVLATGGSLVTHADTYARLRETCFVVWLRAAADDHWSRTITQGDTRPMRHHPDARAELGTILAQREPLYALADLVLDTSAQAVDQCVAAILAAVA
jgi:XRE family transcriptional regulator, aerobic/anaerobic benzoate catabolism transcriptional regulator